MVYSLQFYYILKSLVKNLFGEYYETTSGEMFSTIQHSPCFRIYFGFIVGCGDGNLVVRLTDAPFPIDLVDKTSPHSILLAFSLELSDEG